MANFSKEVMFLKKSDFTLDEWVSKMSACKFSKPDSIEYYNSDDENTKGLVTSQSLHLYETDKNHLINEFMLMFFELNDEKQIKDLQMAFDIVKRKKKSK